MRWNSLSFFVHSVAVLALASLLSPAWAGQGYPASPSKPATAAPQCNGAFTDGKNAISVKSPVYMPDVPMQIGQQTDCDVYTFAWNQFLYYTQMSADPNNGGQVTPGFLHMAPWYNTLTMGPKPGAYPGGGTDLRTAFLDQGQAGTDGHLVDVAGQTVRYDIRFDVNMYDSIVMQNYYTAGLFAKACDADPKNNGTCKNTDKIWMSPAGANERPEPGSIEIKTAWRDFGTPANCPSTEYYCNGRFGLVGLHYVNKTFSHGEWIWATFEHVANAPDCSPGGDEPIAKGSPLGTPWSFFNPVTAGSGVLSSQVCSVTASPPQCNANPNPSGDKKTYVQVNICRTDMLAGGGASAANCAVTPGNDKGNVACLNATLMPQLAGVWQHYKLAGAVWVSGGMGPNQDFRIQIFQQQQQGIPYATPIGFPHMADTAMETWLQTGSTGYDPFGINGTQAGCFLCHNLPSAYGSGNRQADMSHFPGKLPLLQLKTRIKELLKAKSEVKAPN